MSDADYRQLTGNRGIIVRMTKVRSPLEYRQRVFLKSTILFAIVIGLSAAFSQPSPTRSDSIVIFAPHPDDEVIGCAGIIMQALARGARVKVVDITSGDGFDAAAAGVTHKPVDKVGPDDFLALSRLRQTESRTALDILGGTP